jgi:acyl-CoA thioester hydrolase
MEDQAMNRPTAPESRAAYKHWLRIPTRWMDNDIYGHVNNVVYYSYFDTVINAYLIDEGGLDIQNDAIVGITPETFCRFRDSFTFPEVVEAGLAVGRLGETSVTYLIGLFKEGAETPAALGHFVHVFVERESQRPVAMPPAIRAALEKLRIDGDA